MTKSLESNFYMLMQKIGLESQDTEINMEVERQIYDGAFVDGLGMGQNFERQRILGIFRQRSRYGGLSERVYEKLKQKIEGRVWR